jgi:hypothetical protein
LVGDFIAQIRDGDIYLWSSLHLLTVWLCEGDQDLLNNSLIIGIKLCQQGAKQRFLIVAQITVRKIPAVPCADSAASALLCVNGVRTREYLHIALCRGSAYAEFIHDALKRYSSVVAYELKDLLPAFSSALHVLTPFRLVWL